MKAGTIKKKKRIIIRATPFNHLSFPVLLNVWERHGIDTEFEIIIREAPFLPGRSTLKPGELKEGDAVLFSFMTSTLPGIHREIMEIKAQGIKDILIVGGGPHVTGEQKLSRAIGFDILFVGPAESTFLEWGLDLLDNRPIKEEYRFQGDIGSVADFNNALPVSKYFRSIPPVEIMRGCFWNCTYCSTPQHRILFRNLDSIRKHLEAVKKRKFKRVNITSPSAMEYGASKGRKVDLDRIEALLKLLHSYNFVFLEYGIFPSEVRPDTVTQEGMALLKRYVTNKSITIGAQSGLNQRLRQLRRGHTIQETEQAIAIANDYGFLVNLDFIVGYPDETTEERQATLAFIKQLVKKYRIRTHLHHFIPLSGSPYGFRFPARISEPDRQQLRELKKAGITSDGWELNLLQAQEYFAWLKQHFPSHYSEYRTKRLDIRTY